MPIESDEQNADSRLAVKFYKRAVKQDYESNEAGRPIYKDFDFVRIMVAGDNLTEIDTYALESHKQRFPRQWLQYQASQDSSSEIHGTPIEQWPLISQSQAQELRAIKFLTVESVANASDLQLQRIGMIAGMSPHSFRDKAKSFLNLATESAEASKRAEEINQLKQELAQKAEENAKIKQDTDAKLALMQEQMAALLATVTEKKTRTRKPKVVEEA
jgi:predicted transcriptional regulator